MGPSPPSDPSRSGAAADSDELLQATLANVLRACDIVFGTTSIALALIGTWLFTRGEVRLLTVAALWAIPAFNTAWSELTKRRDRSAADLVRGAVCLPIATYLYVAEAGAFEKMWIPSLLMSVGIAISTGIASRRSLLGYLVTLAYAGALFGVATLVSGRVNIAAVDDALGIALTGCVISIVAARLGGTLDEARRQRDLAREQKDRAETVLQQLTQRSRELTTAVENLHEEMKHRMRVEVELRQAQKLESVGRLAAGVAHEINTPVQFVSDSLLFVRDGVGELFELVDKLELDSATNTADLPYLVENVPKALDRALEGLDRVATIVRSMKEFAHPDSKDMEYADLNHAIANTLTMARNEYRAVADLETDFAELPQVRCHIGELNQVVLNVVINAVHAIDDVVRGTDDKGRIRVRTAHEGDEVVIAIADTGSGIPEEARAHVFDPFFTTKQVGRGSGQGLAIAHSVIVDKHHGQIGFETELGKGTTFWIRLPIHGWRAPAAEAALANAEPPADANHACV